MFSVVYMGHLSLERSVPHLRKQRMATRKCPPPPNIFFIVCVFVFEGFLCGMSTYGVKPWREYAQETGEHTRENGGHVAEGRRSKQCL